MTTKKRVLIIPAAGAGVRFRELGRAYPKCVLPVRGTPIIVQILDALASHEDGKYEAFDLVVIPCASKAHQYLIDTAILKTAERRKHPPIETFVVQVPPHTMPSPAVSLYEATSYIVNNYSADEDFDMTIFLSDMLPRNTGVAKDVLKMPTDCWLVTPKPEGDFNRWCMVEGGTENRVVNFYDKPAVQPNTDLAAVGVYRYSSALEWRRAMIKCPAMRSIGYSEMQYSDVAREYMKRLPLTIKCFSPNSFVDFGTLEEYLANKGINKCREFNEVREDGPDAVVKTSQNHVKIRNEINWYQNCPLDLQRYTPRIIVADPFNNYLKMEKVRSSNLRDVALYYDRSYDSWVEIFTRTWAYINLTTRLSVSVRPIPANDFWEEMAMKTSDRVDVIQTAGMFDQQMQHEASILEDQIYDTMMSEMVRPVAGDCLSYFHGDLHFANMFYCFHYKDLKVIDPRGELRGSVLYDIAKLCHSVFGRYDYIDAELYSLVDDERCAIYYDAGHHNIERAFNDVIFSKLPAKTQRFVLMVTASLFFSMIPLHKDKPEHCRLFLKEAKRMYDLALAIDIESDEELQ